MFAKISEVFSESASSQARVLTASRKRTSQTGLGVLWDRRSRCAGAEDRAWASFSASSGEAKNCITRHAEAASEAFLAMPTEMRRPEVRPVFSPLICGTGAMSKLRCGLASANAGNSEPKPKYIAALDAAKASEESGLARFQE